MWLLYVNFAAMILIGALIILIRNHSDAKRYKDFDYTKENPINNYEVYNAYLESNPSNVAQTNSIRVTLEVDGLMFVKKRIIIGYYYYYLKYEDIIDIDYINVGVYRAHISIKHTCKELESPFKFAISSKIYDRIDYIMNQVESK